MLRNMRHMFHQTKMLGRFGLTRKQLSVVDYKSTSPAMRRFDASAAFNGNLRLLTANSEDYWGLQKA